MSTFERDLFSERLRQRRKECSYERQSDFAEAVGISVQSLNYYELGERLPNAEVLFSIAEKLNCSVDWLLGKIDNVSQENNLISRMTGLNDPAILELFTSFGEGSTAYLFPRNTEIMNAIISGGHFRKLVSLTTEFINSLESGQKFFNIQNNDEPKYWEMSLIEQEAFRYSQIMQNLFEDILTMFSTRYGRLLAMQKLQEFENIGTYLKRTKDARAIAYNKRIEKMLSELTELNDALMNTDNSDYN